MAYSLICLSMICCCIGAGSASQTRSAGWRLLSSSAAPGAARPSTSTLLQEPELVAADEVGLRDQIRRPDRVGPEPQMRNGLRS